MVDKDFNTILAEMHADHANQAGTQPGIVCRTIYAAVASALWALWKVKAWVLRQIFPDTADTAQLEHHAMLFGMTRRIGETDAELLSRLLLRLREPPAGGNKTDWERWVTEFRMGADGVYKVPDDYQSVAYPDIGDSLCIPTAQGPGTVDVVAVMAHNIRILTFHSVGYTSAEATDLGKTVEGTVSESTGTLLAYDNSLRRWWVRCEDETAFSESEDPVLIESGTGAGTTQQASYSDVPYTNLLTQVTAYVQTVAPVGISQWRIIPVTRVGQQIWLNYGGTGTDLDAAETAIRAYMNALKPGEALRISQLTAAVVGAGADWATAITPNADVSAASTSVIRDGGITLGI